MKRKVGNGAGLVGKLRTSLLGVHGREYEDCVLIASTLANKNIMRSY